MPGVSPAAGRAKGSVKAKAKGKSGAATESAQAPTLYAGAAPSRLLKEQGVGEAAGVVGDVPPLPYSESDVIPEKGVKCYRCDKYYGFTWLALYQHIDRKHPETHRVLQDSWLKTRFNLEKSTAQQKKRAAAVSAGFKVTCWSSPAFVVFAAELW